MRWFRDTCTYIVSGKELRWNHCTSDESIITTKLQHLKLYINKKQALGKDRNVALETSVRSIHGRSHQLQSRIRDRGYDRKEGRRKCDHGSTAPCKSVAEYHQTGIPSSLSQTQTSRLSSHHYQHASKSSSLQQSQLREGKALPAVQLFTMTIHIVNNVLFNIGRISNTHP